ncbi:hypothetical protein [Pseudomonas caricapapayae]|uniref:hypothetical protein n=2 Tax=Pseudomonas caricapapayae TaxID=46678 RepID=UPI000F00CC04|nr:hypothetical protein [Pseudomonas caricapapayae]KAA8691311.1 hypothetical protein F4W67_25235 [Pseudomonas caricapapayae]
MELHHSTHDDLPTQTQRERERLRLEKAVSEYVSRGGCVHEVRASHRSSEPSFILNAKKTAQLKADTGAQTRKPANALSDTELARLLKAHCTAGSSLASAAASLSQTRKRCEAIARRYQIPFRSAAFSNERART